MFFLYFSASGISYFYNYNLSYREGSKWVDIARSTDPLPNRRKWVGFLSISGKHHVQVFYQKANSDQLLTVNTKPSVTEVLNFAPFLPETAKSITEEGTVANQNLQNESKNTIVGSRKMIRDELIEIRIDAINSDYVDGLEIGVRKRVTFIKNGLGIFQNFSFLKFTSISRFFDF